jgi:transcription initiation factor TFIID subunit TAF12
VQQQQQRQVQQQQRQQRRQQRRQQQRQQQRGGSSGSRNSSGGSSGSSSGGSSSSGSCSSSGSSSIIMTELNLLRGVFERVDIEHSHGSVLWPLTALFLHSVIFVWFFLDGFTSAQFPVYILHISFQF